jgi:hypothetical protein
MAQLHAPISVQIMNVKVDSFFRETHKQLAIKCRGLNFCFGAVQISEEDLSPDFRTKLHRRLQPSEANLVLRTLLRNMILDAETLRLVGFDDFVGEEV